MAVRTIFNLLGPLTNPAGASKQLLGVFSKDWVEPLAKVLKNLGSKHVLVVHSADGMDELSIAAPSYIAELKDNEIKTYEITPEQFNLKRAKLDSLIVRNPTESLNIMLDVLNNKTSVAKDIVLLNAGAAIYTADLTNNLADGIVKADEVISKGLAKKKLEDLVNLSSTQ
jgi:anthranilate phosphoribosyltransferase